MNNYNDFQILSNEQYKEINDYYKNKMPSHINIQSIANKLQFCLNSFLSIQNNFNKNTQAQISSFVSQLKDIKESFKILYPTVNFCNNNTSINLFSILHEIVNIITLLTNLKTQSPKNYYKKTISKITNQVLNGFSMLMLILSTQDIKFFKFM